MRALANVAVASSLVAALAAPPRVQAQPIEFPETGTPAERTQSLWRASRTRILADAKAAHSDAEYQQRRAPLWSAWIRLQMELAGADDRVSRIIPDVLGLLNDTYGWTADPPPSARRTATGGARPRKRA